MTRLELISVKQLINFAICYTTAEYGMLHDVIYLFFVSLFQFIFK